MMQMCLLQFSTALKIILQLERKRPAHNMQKTTKRVITEYSTIVTHAQK